MNEAPEPKQKDPTEWGNYFKHEFKMQKIRRGINQAEKLDEDEIRALIGEMVLECKAPAYKHIDKVILQRVITDSVINDTNFFGFTVSWVRSTLNKWWHLSGWKLNEKIQREKEAEAERNRPAPTVNPHEDVMLTVQAELKRRATEVPEWMKSSKKMNPEISAKEGKEWTSNIERKGINYKPQVDPVEWEINDFMDKEYARENHNVYTGEKLPGWMYKTEWLKSKGLNMERDPEVQRLILKAASEYYQKKKRTKDLELFIIGGYYVMAESEQDANEIYSQCN